MSAARQAVNEKSAVRYLLSPEGRRVLFVFMSGPTHVKLAAEQLNLPLKKMHYKVSRLLEMKLLVECGEKKLSGRRRKLYKAAADVFEVPFDRSEFSTLSDLMVTISSFKKACEYYEAAFRASYHGPWKIELMKDLAKCRNHLTVGFGPTHPSDFRLSDATPSYGTGAYLNLSTKDAQALVEDLQTLLETYTTLSQESEENRDYFLSLNFVSKSS